MLAYKASCPLLPRYRLIYGDNAIYNLTHSPSRLAWSWVGGRLALFYIHQMNRVNSGNGSAMMTAP